MPVIKSAIKKLRQDKVREKQNDGLRDMLKSSVRKAKKSKTGKSVAKAISVVDKAAKKNIIHTNKASRLKASLSKIAKPEAAKKVAKTSPTVKKPKTAKRTPAKRAAK